jgi:hypothetical protein
MKRKLTPLLLAITCLAAGATYADSITFYENDNYRGRNFTTDRPMENFDRSGFNDRVKSAVVHDGSWEICVDAEFRGSCGVLAPGAYPNLGAYADRVSSVRPVDARRARNGYEDRGRSREAHATLYEGRNMSGRSYALSDTMQNLGATGFNDRASSLRVERGYWIFCSDAGFQGECRTFGPGDYASLPGMNDVISSGRQIANDYPYDSKPDWQRGYYHQPPAYQSRSQ